LTNLPKYKIGPALRRSFPMDNEFEKDIHLEGNIQEVDLLIDRLPARLNNLMEQHGYDELIEIVLDLGRPPVARYRKYGEVLLSDAEVTQQEIDQTVAQLSEFGDDNRAGIPRTLHRVSAIRNRRERIVGLTCRVGRTVSGSAGIIGDLIEKNSILLLGPPGVGKTTMLRDVARTLADELGKRVVVVDTSNEIGGDGDIPHPGIGKARRMQVSSPELQHRVMIEAVENHTPETIIIDEIGTALEADAARTIAERGVQLIGTAHGNSLTNLMQNPTLSDLIGGIESVTLGDDEARRRDSQKTILERRAAPTFGSLVEIHSFSAVAVHEDVARTVDEALRGFKIEAEFREIKDGRMHSLGRKALSNQTDDVQQKEKIDNTRNLKTIVRQEFKPERKILAFGVSRSRLEEAISGVRMSARMVDSVDEADCVITLRPYYRRRSGPLRRAEQRAIPIYVLRNNTIEQMERQLESMHDEDRANEPITIALREAEEAANKILYEGVYSVELSPQNGYVRRLQHELIARYGLTSASRGSDPSRRVSAEANSLVGKRKLSKAVRR